MPQKVNADLIAVLRPYIVSIAQSAVGGNTGNFVFLDEETGTSHKVYLSDGVLYIEGVERAYIPVPSEGLKPGPFLASVDEAWSPVQEPSQFVVGLETDSVVVPPTNAPEGPVEPVYSTVVLPYTI